MSRALKFRAWNKEGKRMCYGIDGDDNPFWRDGDCFGHVEMVNFELSNRYYIWEQSTGSLDKNGKEIYEGDILETCCGKAEVYFDDELLMYKIEVRHGGTMPLVSKKSKRHFDYEIIGNIHENPELLEKGE